MQDSGDNILIKLIFSVFWLVCTSLPAHGKTEDSDAKQESEALTQEERDKALIYLDPPYKPLSAKEKMEICRKYSGKYLGYYGRVFWVKRVKGFKDCKKHVLSPKDLKTRQSVIDPEDVSSRVIAGLSSGIPYEDLQKKERSCKQLEGNYVAYDLEYYWLSGCKLRRFPDNATLQDHRRKNNFFAKKTLDLSPEEFASIPLGREFKTVLVLDDMDSKAIVVLPIDEACRSIVNKHVSYLDKIYLIKPFKKGKGCWKKPVDQTFYARQMLHRTKKLKELSSSQALSIPDYEP